MRLIQRIGVPLALGAVAFWLADAASSPPFWIGALAVVCTLAGMFSSERALGASVGRLEAWLRAHPSGRPAPRSAFRPLRQLAARVERRLGETEEALSSRRARNRNLKVVLDALADGVWTTDSAGTVVRHNRALTRMLGDDRPFDGDLPIEILRNPELSEAVERACREDRATSLEIELEAPVKKVLSVDVQPLSGKLPGSTAVFRDVTELRRLEKIRKDFVANVSHELNTPITAIRGYAETLLSGTLTDPARAQPMVDVIHRQSVRLSELVSALLTLSGIEGRRPETRNRPIRIDLIARRAVATLCPSARSKEVALEPPDEAAVWAMGDEEALERVLLNLLENAIKYMDGPGTVRVSVGACRGTSSGAERWIRVEDTGPGIAPEHLDRIFERFYRIDQGRSRDLGGAGLGLSIVKHLVSSMGGVVEVTSAPGEGTRFTVRLGAAQPPTEDREGSDGPDGGSSPGGQGSGHTDGHPGARPAHGIG